MSREEIKEIIKNFFVKHEYIEQGEIIDPNIVLADIYNIDSLEYVDIIMYCEEQFLFEFEVEDLNLDNFATLNMIVDIITKKLEKS